MMNINSKSMDVEVLLNQVSRDFSQSDMEDKRVSKARIKSHSDTIRDKRQERIDNLKEQLKGAKGSGGGPCFKALRSVAKVFDFLTKPLSLLSLGQIKLELGKVLDQLQTAKKQGKLLGLHIDGQKILQTLQSFKSLLSEDMDKLNHHNQQSQKETERIMRIIEDLESNFENTLRKD